MEDKMEAKHVLEIRRLRAENAVIKTRLVITEKIDKQRKIAVMVAVATSTVALLSSILAYLQYSN